MLGLPLVSSKRKKPSALAPANPPADLAASVMPPAATASGAIPRRRLIFAGKVAATVISVVSFVTGVIAVIPILTRDTSRFESLTIEVTPYPQSSTEWAVPLTADFGSYPVAERDTCGDAQLDWLEQRGQRVTTRLLVDFRNAATDGPMLTVKDFRVVGTRAEPADAMMLVVCDTAPRSGIRLQAARIDASSDANVAVYSADAFGLGAEGIPDIPVTWNLAPGEGGQLIVNVASSIAFEGELDATILSGTESRIQALGTDTIGTLSAPALLGLGTVFLQATGTLECQELVDSDFVACELTEVLTRER